MQDVKYSRNEELGSAEPYMSNLRRAPRRFGEYLKKNSRNVVKHTIGISSTIWSANLVGSSILGLMTDLKSSPTFDIFYQTVLFVGEKLTPIVGNENAYYLTQGLVTGVPVAIANIYIWKSIYDRLTKE